MKNFFKFALILLIICGIIVVFFLLRNNNTSNLEISKVNEEVQYLSDRIIRLSNGLNNINFSAYVKKEEMINNINQNEEQNNNSSSSGGEGNNGGNSKQSKTSKTEQGSSNTEGSNNEESSKTVIKYNLINNEILTSKDNSIDWNSIKSESESLYSLWTNTIVDLHSLNVENQDILNFSNLVDQLIISCKNEDKLRTITILANMYSYIPKYEKHYIDDTKKIDLSYVKSNVINAYALTEQDDWDGMKLQMQQAKEHLATIINLVDGNNKNQSKVNDIYIQLNELTNSIDKKDKELFFIKYKALMETITTM